MIMSPFFLKRIVRAPAKHIAVLLVCLLLAGLIGFLSEDRTKQYEKLEEVQKTAEVLCVVTDNKGTKATSLGMGYSVIFAVTDLNYYRLPEFVKDVRAVKEFKIGGEPVLYAITSPKCAENLDPDKGGEVTLFRDDFYESDEFICLISEQAYDSLAEEAKLQDYVTDPRVNPELRKTLNIPGTDRFSFIVAGYYQGKGSEIYIPFETGMIICDELARQRTVDSLSFLAKDNTRLDELRDAASDVFDTVDPYGHGGAHRFSLTIHDEDYQLMLSALHSNIERAGYLIPAVYVITLLVGFLMGFLTTRSEKHSFALQRSVGMTKKRLLMSVLSEQLSIPLLSCVIAALVFGSVLPILITFLLYALGCSAAIIRAVSVSPMQLLREQE